MEKLILLSLMAVCLIKAKSKRPSIDEISGIEKAYINENGLFSNPIEVADWLYKTCKRKYYVGLYLDSNQTRDLINLMKKRYDIDTYTETERLLAGLFYYQQISKKYSIEFVRNFGQYNFFIDKKY